MRYSTNEDKQLQLVSQHMVGAFKIIVWRVGDESSGAYRMTASAYYEGITIVVSGESEHDALERIKAVLRVRFEREFKEGMEGNE